MDKETNATARSLKREEMIKYGYDLFYKNGFHATGVDAIIEGTGISKRTLYKHFISKDGLILATVAYYHQKLYGTISDYLEKSTLKNPIDKGLRIFDFLLDLLDTGHVYGCFAMNAKNEYANKSKEIEQACEVYFTALLDLVESYLKQANVTNSKQMAMQVMMLFEGAILRSKGTGDSKPIKLAKEAAKTICNR